MHASNNFKKTCMRLASFVYWASVLHQSLALTKSTQPDNYLASPADSKNADKSQTTPTGLLTPYGAPGIQPASITAEPQDLNSNTNLRGSQPHLFSSPDIFPETALRQPSPPPESAQTAQSQPKAPPETAQSQPNAPPESAQTAQSQPKAPPQSTQSQLNAPPETAQSQPSPPPESAQTAQSQPKAPPETAQSQPNAPPETAQSQPNAPPETAQTAQSQPKAPAQSTQSQLNAPPSTAQSQPNAPPESAQTAQSQLNAPPASVRSQPNALPETAQSSQPNALPETALSQPNAPPETAQSQPNASPLSAQSQLNAPPLSAQSQLNAPPSPAQSQPDDKTPVQPAPPLVTPDILRPKPAFWSDNRLIETKGTTTTPSPTIMKASSAIQDWATAVEQKPSLRQNLTSAILREVGGSGSGCLETREQNKCLASPCYFVLRLNLCLPYCEAFTIESRCTEGCRWEKEACRTQMMLEPLAKPGSLLSIDQFMDSMGLDYINCASIIDEKFCTLMGERLKSLVTLPLTKDSQLGVCKWDGNYKICVDEKFTMLGDAEKDDFLKIEKPVTIDQSSGCDAVHLKPHNGVLDPDKDDYRQGEKIQVKCDPGYQPSNSIRGTLVCSSAKLMPRIYCIPNPQFFGQHQM